MTRWARAAASASVVLGLAAGLLAVGAAAGAPPETSTEAAATVAASDPLAGRVEALQAALDRTPGSWTAWSALGMAYVEQARVTTDPGLYEKAGGAFARSLELRPDDNDGALTGQASLAAARHQFAQALALTDRSLAVNDYNATTYAVRVDALNELGRYDDARRALQRMLDLRPGVDALTRASYVFELAGDVSRATDLLQQAAENAVTPADTAFAQYYLGEIAWNGGDLAAARRSYDAALAADPDSSAARAGRARVLAATGDPRAALGELRAVVERFPAPEFLVAYGELLEATGQQDAALEQYEVVRATQQLHAANGQDVDTELALFEADHGSPAAAVAAAEQAYAKRPQSIFTQDAYAWALHKAGRSDQALPIARAATRTGYRSPALLARVGTIEAAAGDVAAARATLERALGLNPQFSPLHAPRAADLLASLR